MHIYGWGKLEICKMAFFYILSWFIKDHPKDYCSSTWNDLIDFKSTFNDAQILASKLKGESCKSTLGKLFTCMLLDGSTCHRYHLWKLDNYTKSFNLWNTLKSYFRVVIGIKISVLWWVFIAIFFIQSCSDMSSQFGLVTVQYHYK